MYKGFNRLEKSEKLRKDNIKQSTGLISAKRAEKEVMAKEK